MPGLLQRGHELGKWDAVYRELGIPASLLDKRAHKCPYCKERTPGGLRFADNGEQFGRFYHGSRRFNPPDMLMHAFGVSVAEAMEMIESVIGKGDVEADRSEWAKARNRLRLIDQQAIRGGRDVEAYLASRGLEPVDYLKQGVVRTDREYTSMLAKLLSPDGQALTFHATLLEGGRKASCDPNKRLLGCGGQSLSGGAMRLMPATEVLGVAEGIESALAASKLHGIPVWACGNTALLSSFRPPPNVNHLVIFADNDANSAGQLAAHQLKHRLFDTVPLIDVEIPPRVGTDFADVLLDRRRAA